jgi:serine/threonine-protein kinase RsbW
MSTERWSFPAVPASVPQARRVARELGVRHNLGRSLLDAIALCVSEAVTNAVVHAYRDRAEPGHVELVAQRLSDALCVRVRDAGMGMIPRVDSPGIGLGLPLIAQLAGKVEIRESAGLGTEIVMHFPVG